MFLFRPCESMQFSLDVMSKVQDVRKSSLTFAPEAGSQRLRNVINKGLTEENILNGCDLAFKGGWNKVKLYFMLGLPTETEEDMRGDCGTFREDCREYYYEIPKEERNGKVSITASTSFFCTKAVYPVPVGTDVYQRRIFITRPCGKQQNERNAE